MRSLTQYAGAKFNQRHYIFAVALYLGPFRKRGLQGKGMVEKAANEKERNLSSKHTQVE